MLTEDQLNDEILKASLREKALKTVYMKRMEEVAQCRSEEMELREAFRLLEEAFIDGRQERFDIISDFTRQYKATEDALIGRCTELDNMITDLKDQQELSRLALTETERERDHYSKLKDDEYEDQDKKMKDMEEEFKVMLSVTQDRMTTKVENAMNAAGQEDDDASDE